MKILAAGKTSSERAALSIARELGLDTGGRCRKGGDYHDCVSANSAAAEATIVLTRSRYPQLRTTRHIHRTPSPASSDIMLTDHRSIPGCREWFRRDRVGVLHVTGHLPYSEAKQLLRAILQDFAKVERSAETGS
jgi:hypothetical protein